MSLFVTSLNSGSNGNCYYIGNSHEAVLVDAGLSCRETEKRMKRLGLKMDMVRALFISHEHGDHIRGVEGLISKYDIPVYITAPTLHHGRLRIPEHLVKAFTAFEAISIGDLSVVAFPKLHDASDPHSFIIRGNGVNIGVFTDIGTPCQHVVSHFKQCHAAFLETNYDDGMLDSGRYPFHLKRRIRGDQGHLSNHQAMELFTTHRPHFMSHLFLAHLSQDNNDAEMVFELFRGIADDVTIVVASRHRETAVHHIYDSACKQAEKTPATIMSQMSLF